MRLTLRTLLAFLDNILEQEDRAALEKKIQESDFAQNLIQRSRDTVNDQELAALDPIGQGMRQDPNVVAEYLDNTMPREEIEEFERQCIENGSEADTRLAEVTSCHHILTMVLGDPVQFSASSRDRMYRIVSGNASSDNANFQTPGQRTADVDSSPQPDGEQSAAILYDTEDNFNPADLLPGSNVPDYLRGEEQQSRWLPIMATTLVAAVVTGVLLTLFEPGAESKRTRNSSTVAKVDAVPLPKVNQIKPSATEPASKIGSSQSESPLTDDDKIIEKVTTALPAPAITEGSPVTAETAKVSTGEVVNASIDNAKSDESPVLEQDAAKSISAESVSVGPAREPSDSGEDAATDAGEETVKLEKRDSIPRDAADTEEITPAKLPTVEKSNEQSQVLGRLVSDDQILLVTPSDFDELRWLPPQSNLKQGHKLLALPTFRPNLSLLAFTVELDGGSLLELMELGSGGTPTIRLAYGRMVVRTNFDGGKFRLKINNQRTITVTMSNTETAIGVEVIPGMPPGQNPEMDDRDHKINVYVISGSVEWQEAGQRGVVAAGQLQGLGRLPATAAESFESAPDWLTTVKISNLEKRAVPDVRNVLREARPVKLSFQELVSKRRQEVKRLALRCCAYIGYFDPLVESLSDENMKRHWDNCASDLYASLKRHPEYANRVREALERLRGDQSTDLYRMLLGYTNENLLKQSQAQRLVEFLSSEDLDIRVLSHWNLKNITGKQFSYQPAEKSESKRRVSIKRYENLLNKDEIKHKGE